MLVNRTHQRTSALFYLAAMLLFPLASQAGDKPCPSYLNMQVQKLHSSDSANLCEYYQAGKPLLVVNTASRCGYTPQFKDLEALYQKHKDNGLVVLGFPSDSFNQEEDQEADTARVCYKNYGVSFPMFTHVAVKGEQAHPLFKYLAERSQAPSWNFNKYVLRDDQVWHFESNVEPMDAKLQEKLVF